MHMLKVFNGSIKSQCSEQIGRLVESACHVKGLKMDERFNTVVPALTDKITGHIFIPIDT